MVKPNLDVTGCHSKINKLVSYITAPKQNLGGVMVHNQNVIVHF